MAPFAIFRFQNIMYVVEIFAVISEVSTLRASTRLACIIEQHLKYKSVPPEIWYTVRSLWMAPISIFRFQNIMYVVDIFAVISEGSSSVRVYMVQRATSEI